MSLEGDLIDIASSAGVDHYGVADLTTVQSAIRDQGGDVTAAYPYAISLGINLIHPLVDNLKGDSDTASILYQHYVYDVVNTRIDTILSHMAGRIQNEGYIAFPVPASKRTDDERIASFFSHKLAAHCAGLGWIGKSCLLITPDAGPRVRWGSILTNAPLSSAGTPMDERCGTCRECVDACPVQAFSGEPFRSDEPREVRFDASLCDLYFKSLRNQGKEAICGLCVYSCPYGKKASNSLKKL
jgi:epoxyqueuosine reductase QueG